jgi:hypothetical protein
MQAAGRAHGHRVNVSLSSDRRQLPAMQQGVRSSQKLQAFSNEGGGGLGARMVSLGLLELCGGQAGLHGNARRRPAAPAVELCVSDRSLRPQCTPVSSPRQEQVVYSGLLCGPLTPGRMV